jgi:ATP-binding cassette, subfamily B, bacterial
MFDRRLFTLVPRSGVFVVAKVLSLWVSLLADIGCVFIFTGLLDKLFPVLAGVNDQGKPSAVSALLKDFQAVPDGYSAFVFALVAIVIVKYLAVRCSHFFGTEASSRIKISLRERLYNKMLDLGPTYCEHVKTADVVQSLTEGVDRIEGFFRSFLPQLAFAILAPLTFSVVLLPLSAPVAGVLLVCVPLIVGIVVLVSVMTSRAYSKYWDHYTNMGAAFLDNVQGLETLKTFDADEAAAQRMDQKSEDFRKSSMKVLRIEQFSRLAMDLISYGGTVGAIGIVVWQVASGHLKLATALVVILLSVMFFVPLRQLGLSADTAMDGIAAVRRIYALLDAPAYSDGQSALPQGIEDCSVTFRNVSYTYGAIGEDSDDTLSIQHVLVPEDLQGVSSTENHGEAGAKEKPKALDSVSFTTRPNGFTAIVGVSGSGKSTVASLIAGRRGDYEGSIRLGYRVFGSVGSCELHSLKNRSLLESVTVVDSHSHLFAGTLRDNLLMAKPDATANEMWLALEGAHIDDFVYSHPERLDMVIEADASNLSGGQRQRLAIARALLRDSPIYVFDEATSSVDSDSERLIDGTIRELAQSRTVIVITHRLNQTVDAGNIVVLDAGRVVESGTHTELMASGGRYATMFRTQESIGRVSHRKSWGSAYAGQVPRTDEVSRPFDFALLDYRNQDEHEDEKSSGDSNGSGRKQHDDNVLRSSSGHRLADVTHAGSSFVKAAVHSEENEMGRRLEKSSNSASSVTSQGATDSLLSNGRDGIAGAGATDVQAEHVDVTSDIADRPHDDDRAMGTARLIVRLFGCVGPLAPLMVGASMCGVVGYLAGTFLPVSGVLALMAVLGHPIWGMSVGLSVLAMAMCAVLRGLMRYAEEYMNHDLSFRVLSLLRSKTFEALRRLAPAKLKHHGDGNLTALMTADIEALEMFFAHAISPVVIAVSTSVVFAVLLWTLDPCFALLLIVAHLFIGIVLPRFYANNVRGIGDRIRDNSAMLSNRLIDDLRGIDEIIRFNQGSRRLSDIVRDDRNLWLFNGRLSRKNGVFEGLGAVSAIAFSFVAIKMVFGVVQANPVSIAQSLVAFVLILSSFGPTLALNILPGSLAQPLAAARRFFELCDENPALEENGTDKPKFDAVSLKGVTFAYPSNSSLSGMVSSPALVLKDFDLTTLHSGILGIQGASGRGKSTILKLMMRYWDPQQGSVDFSGGPLPGLEPHYRRHVETMMGEETYLFDGTVRDNLLIANPQAKDADLHVALERASVASVIEALPDGLDTAVGELGNRLSEGERQRIGLARVFLTDASLVLFDEPTSQVDSLNESVILRSINTLASERPVSIVLVSHRASTMQIADRVITL